MLDSLKIRVLFIDHEFPHDFTIEAGQRYPYIAPKICYRHAITSSTSTENIVFLDILSHWTPIMGLLDAIRSICKYRDELEHSSCVDMNVVVGQELAIAEVHTA